MADQPLSDRERIFVEEYLVDLDQTAACRRMGARIGFTYKVPKVVGCLMYKRPRVQAAIQAAMDKRSKRTSITADRVLTELAHMGFANMLDYISTQGDGSAFVDLSELTREQAAAIQEVTVESYTEGKGEEAREVKRIKFKLADKRGSLELLGKHLKLFTEKREITFPSLENATNEQLSDLAVALGIPTGGLAACGTA